MVMTMKWNNNRWRLADGDVDGSGGLFQIWGGESLIKAKEQGTLLMNLYYVY